MNPSSIEATPGRPWLGARKQPATLAGSGRVSAAVMAGCAGMHRGERRNLYGGGRPVMAYQAAAAPAAAASSALPMPQIALPSERWLG